MRYLKREAELRKSPFFGALFEGFIAAEVVKAQLNEGRRREIYFFRDEQGLEVDFVVPGRDGAVSLIEAKATRTPVPRMAESMNRLAAAFRKSRGESQKVRCLLVHSSPKKPFSGSTLSPGVDAIAVGDFLADPLG